MNNDLLRFTTAGSVDDGKSTLIGRLLYDSKSIFEDQMAHIVESSKRRGKEEVDLSLLTDGLKAEREQGITIDVAYRYFATPKRKFIIADTPGHIQYTRNMVTGASTADLALILIDARNGVLEQTVRHTFIASLLDIKHIVFCINKMDLVEFSQEVYDTLSKELKGIAAQLKVKDVRFVPISAKFGDNVVDRSDKTPWYDGPTLIETLETVEVTRDRDLVNPRFPVQYVVRPGSDEHHDYRGYAGRIAGGYFSPGDEVVVLPSMLKTKVKSVDQYEKSLKKAMAGDSVVITLEDDIDITRGNMIATPSNMPSMEQEIEMMICWFNPRPLVSNGKYAVRHTSNETRAVIKGIKYKVNINTLEENTEDLNIGMNDIARISIKTANPLFFDTYKKNNNTGSVILIDEGTNETMGAGMIL